MRQRPGALRLPGDPLKFRFFQVGRDVGQLGVVHAENRRTRGHVIAQVPVKMHDDAREGGDDPRVAQVGLGHVQCCRLGFADLLSLDLDSCRWASVTSSRRVRASSSELLGLLCLVCGGGGGLASRLYLLVRPPAPALAGRRPPSHPPVRFGTSAWPPGIFAGWRLLSRRA